MHNLPLVAGHCWQAVPFAALGRKEACQLALYALNPLLVGPGVGQQQGAICGSPAAITINERLHCNKMWAGCVLGFLEELYLGALQQIACVKLAMQESLGWL